jgi:heme/copper-type cytochrome/quinol oxidase subunit 2
MGFLSTGSTFASAVQTLIGLLNMIVGVLVALAVVVFFIGLVRYIKDAADSKGHKEGRERIIWSMVALFILFSVWGILALMSVTFFGSDNPSAGAGVFVPSSSSNSPFNTTGSLY